MKTRSIWIQNEKANNILKNNLNVDVLIIGGGITGMSIAYNFINSNLKVCLVESNKIGNGVTSRSTAKLTYLQELIYSDLKKAFSKDISHKYLNSQKEAIKLVKDIVDKNNIDCNYEDVSSIVFTNNKNEISKIKEEKELLKEFQIGIKEIDKLPDGTKVEYGIMVDDTSVFNPIKYLNGLIKICEKNDINIYEKTKVTSISKENDKYVCEANGYKIIAKKVVFATHYPYFLLPFLMPTKCYLEKSYIAASKVNKNYKFSAITSKYPTISMRYYQNKKDIYKIYLMGSHNLCTKYNEKDNFNELLKNVENKPEFIWSNKDIMTNDKLPFIGEIKDNMFLATGYNTWGMTNGTIAGKVISDLILNKENEYISMFDPKRGFNLTKLSSLPLILFSNTKAFVGMKLNKQKSWYSDNIEMKEIDGKEVAIYKDENGKKHMVYNHCPHLGCNLLFNEIEKTWDCPCHGSRFDLDGYSIEGPSNDDICYKN